MNPFNDEELQNQLDEAASKANEAREAEFKLLLSAFESGDSVTIASVLTRYPQRTEKR